MTVTDAMRRARSAGGHSLYWSQAFRALHLAHECSQPENTQRWLRVAEQQFNAHADHMRTIKWMSH